MGKKLRQLTFSDAVLLAALAWTGGFHEYISCVLSAAMGAWLLVRFFRGKRPELEKGPLALAVCAICLFYGLTCLWAIDAGMALVGFFKFLPAGLYLLVLWQEQREGCVLELLPYYGALLAVISGIGMHIPGLARWFSVADRLAGPFQYPNTFALFLLVCELLLLKKQGKKLWDLAVIAVLVAGLLYTGSRTVFVIFALSNGAMLLAVSRKRARAVLLLLGAAVGVAAVILVFSGNAVLGRYLSISLTESTFVGRLLYAADALPLLFKYPFGMGYMGYYYIQQSIQTGVYSVAYIHNDFLQLLLDVGLIPGCLFLWVWGAYFFKKDVPVTDKILMGAVFVHTLLDFNLQFVGFFLLVLKLLSGTQKKLPVKHSLPWKVGLGVLTAAGLYLGAALLLAHTGAYAAADAMYPGNTRNKLTMLEQTEDITRAEALADAILKNNTHYFAPYSIKALGAYSRGDFGALIRYKNAELARNPFNADAYEEYCRMLLNGMALYEQAGDTDSLRICQKALSAAQQRLRDNARRLSSLGRLIKDQPVTELSPQVQEMIRKAGGDGT